MKHTNEFFNNLSYFWLPTLTMYKKIVIFFFNKFSPIKKSWLTLSNIKILLLMFSFFIFWHQILNKVLSTIKLQPTPFVGKKCQICGELLATTLDFTKFISYHGFRDTKALNERYINLTLNPIVMLHHGFYLMATKTILKMVMWAWHVHNTSH
jgi:hypothetical protein